MKIEGFAVVYIRHEYLDIHEIVAHFRRIINNYVIIIQVKGLI